MKGKRRKGMKKTKANKTENEREKYKYNED